MSVFEDTPKSIILFADDAPSATSIVPFVDVRKVTTLESGTDSVAVRSVIFRLEEPLFEPYLILA